MTVVWMGEDTEPVALDSPVETLTDTTDTQRPTKGTCRVCGRPARSMTGTVCDEHDGRRTRSNGATTTPNKKGKGRTTTTTKPPTSTELQDKILTKILIFGTFTLAMRMVKNKGLHDPKDEIAETLALTDEEAKDIAGPIARFVAPTGINKRYGRKLVDNIDVMNAGFALWDWYERVNDFLTNAPNRPLASVHPINADVAEERSSTNVKAESAVAGSGGFDLSDINPDAGILF